MRSFSSRDSYSQENSCWGKVNLFHQGHMNASSILAGGIEANIVNKYT